MNKSFKDLGIKSELLTVLSSLNYVSPTEIQEKAIPKLLENTDLVGLSQTGTGKTLAFALPIIQNLTEEPFVQALILCPTRELAEQILFEMRRFSAKLKNIKAVAVYGGADIQRQIYALKRGANLVIGTPGRIMDHLNRKTLKLGLLKTVVLDEADEMLNMGFRNDMETILKTTPQERQTVMFSATMSKDILAISKNFMQNPFTLQVGAANTTLESIKQSYIVCPKDKKKRALHMLLGELPRGRTIIFCNTKRMVDSVQVYLRKMGFMALALHGDMPQGMRKRIMNEYKNEPNNILITTDIAARGIDVKDIIQVINFDLPQNLEYYIHRVGRTGRAGKGGSAYTLLNSKEQLRELAEIEKKTHSKILKSNMVLTGLSADLEPEEKDSGYKKLNVKPRERRGMHSGNSYTKKTSANGEINVNSNSKFGRKKHTVRQMHKSKINSQNKY